MTRVFVTVLAVLSLGFAACGDDEPKSADETVPTTSSTTADAAPTSTEAVATGDTGEGKPEDSGPAPQAGDQGDAGGEPAASPEEAIRAVLTAAGDPEQACTDFVTSQFVTTAYGGRANCIAARRPSALADSLRITDEGAGEFTVVPEGGPYDGVEVTVEVVDEGGYRVSSLLADIPAGP